MTRYRNDSAVFLLSNTSYFLGTAEETPLLLRSAYTGQGKITLTLSLVYEKWIEYYNHAGLFCFHCSVRKRAGNDY